MPFNINAIMPFGFPVLLNPVFFIPFIPVPITLCLISYPAFSFGLVPATLCNAEWTTPALSLTGPLSAPARKNGDEAA